MRISFLIGLLWAINITLYAQTDSKSINEIETDANVSGHVKNGEEHLPFINLFIKGTNIGTTTDATGHYRIINIPLGYHILVVRAVGYKEQEIEFEAVKNNTLEIKVQLEKDVLGLEEVVITGDRSETQRRESPVVVSKISPKLLQITQSVSINEGLNYCTGLRTENNCQNCGFTQVRMNGLEGPYSQILINSRPLFSGLAGVYGLEMIPTNMIESIEVVRGGGSALYGSNAIAGTVNLILKEPISNTYEVGASTGLIGVGMGADFAQEYNISANVSLVNDNYKAGISLYAFKRNRNPFDANGDSFSELASIENTTFGASVYKRLGTKDKLTLDFFIINEDRRGGNDFDKLPHQSDISEAVSHRITTGALAWERFIGKNQILTTYASVQNVDRNSYYGANQSLDSYGKTDNVTYVVGSNYKISKEAWNFVGGVEYRGEKLIDQKLGYPDIDNAYLGPDSSLIIPHVENTLISKQNLSTFGGFVQADYRWNKMKVSIGARYDRYSVVELENDENTLGNVISPRLNILYDILKNLQFRATYSQGYRAPQIFDEDLHIETSGSRKVINKNEPGLKQESSHSFMASFTYNSKLKNLNYELLVEGFHTQLIDPFVFDYGAPDSEGVVYNVRRNSEYDAYVQGINTELTVVPSIGDYSLKMGFTYQVSRYTEAQVFNEYNFFRTPNAYGFMALDWDPFKDFCISLSANYTGKMLVPYYGLEIPYPEEGELRTSPSFFDLGVKFSYDFNFEKTSFQLYIGMKNILNSYQSDFDYGIDRDPAYMYGPSMPRYLYMGAKLGIF